MRTNSDLDEEMRHVRLTLRIDDPRQHRENRIFHYRIALGLIAFAFLAETLYVFCFHR